MKRNMLALLLVASAGVSSFSYAASPITKDTVIYKDPGLDSKPKFEFSIGALYLQPTSSNLDYAVLGFPLPVQSPHWNVQSVDPGYSFGYTLGARYYFQNSTNDIHASWDHLITSDSDFTQAGANQFAVVLYQAGPSAGQSFNNPSQRASGTAKFNYDVVNLDVGQYVDYGSTQLRLFIGISTARLNETLNAHYQDNAGTFSINTGNYSKFSGIGPLLGVDGLYKLPYGFGIIGTASASALIGNSNPITTFTSRSPQLAAAGITQNNQSITPNNATQVVPGLTGKLGMNYNHLFTNSFAMTLNLGYEYVTYLNAITFYNPSVIFGNINTGTVALSSLQSSTSNYSVSGPFLIADFKFA